MALQLVQATSFVFQGLIANAPFPWQSQWLAYEDHQVPLQGHRNDHHLQRHFARLMECTVLRMLSLCNNQDHVQGEDLVYIAR